KPGNILVSQLSPPDAQPTAKLTDFGIGQVVSQEALAGVTKSDFTRTILAGTSSSKTGTQLYLAPELVAGKAASPQTDLYSLGVVLYQLLVSDLTRPLATDWAREVTHPLLRDDLTKCFAGNPDERFAGAGLLASQLRSLPEREAVQRREAAEASAREQEAHRRARTRAALKLTGTFALLFALAWLMREQLEVWFTRENAARPKDLVVLPFDATAKDTSLQDFGEGLAETISSKLTRLQEFGGSLRVVPMTEIRREKIRSAREARDVFNAAFLLSGNLQRVGDIIRVTINLVDARNLRQINSQSRDFLAGDILALQDYASDLVTDWLEPRALRQTKPLARAGQTRVAAAYEAYVKGYGKLARYERPENVEAAIGFFGEAIKKDPGYALAEAALGESLWRKYQHTRGQQWIVEALEHSKRAVLLEDKLAAAHVTLGVVYAGTGQRGAALAEFKRALEIDPKNPHAYQQLGRAYADQGLLPEAEQTLQRAIALDTNYWGAYNDLGVFHFRFEDYEKAAQNFTRVTELAPDASLGYRNLGGLFSLMGRYADAARLTRQSLKIHPSPEAYSNLGTFCFFQGLFLEATTNFEHAVAMDATDPVIWGNLADAYRLGGLTNKAANMYRQALQRAEQELAVNPDSAETRASVALFAAGLGDSAKAAAAIEIAQARAPEDRNVLFQSALVRELIGERERALAALEAAVDRKYSRAEILAHPDLTSLRQDQRFISIKAKLDALTPSKTNN
ncbi:MAG: tetratricopeptide repeat protein, partial [Verrucomicrobia bacterium]|nr:tetratricopeptide repeat protein [Verrucomicrobiota bacterium]